MEYMTRTERCVSTMISTPILSLPLSNANLEKLKIGCKGSSCLIDRSTDKCMAFSNDNGVWNDMPLLVLSDGLELNIGN